MPKRVPTPPPCDDEPRYLTVVHPYTMGGTCNMELPKDRQDFARWIACFIQKNDFFAIFHKPSSRSMVIIEVNRTFANFDRILGEHRWSEFLRNPSKEENDRVTKVFYCKYSTGRVVQKNGWKRIDVEEAWFKGWSTNNRLIKSPYPPPHFCDVPFEDQTNHSLCSPLPGAIKPTPSEVIAIAAPPPVVGSAQWIQTKEEGIPIASATMPAKTKGAWGKGAPKVQPTSAGPNPTANGSAKAVNTPAGIRVPAVGGGPIVVKSDNVWQTTRTNRRPAVSPLPVAANWDDAESVSSWNTPASHETPPVPPMAPPGLTRPTGASISTSSGAKGASNRSANPSVASWVSNNTSTSSPDSESGPDLTTATESDDPYKVHIHFSESMEEEFRAFKLDEGDLGELDSIAPVPWDGPTAADTWEGATENWDNVEGDAELEWRKKQETEKPILCSIHGLICKKGICAEYARQSRLIKREEERKKAAANRGKKNARGKGRGAAKAAKESQSSEKPTLQPNPFRGPGAPVKTNWRGAPRAIVSADVIEEREGTKAAYSDGSDSDFDDAPNAAAVVANVTSDGASNASWAISENSFDPWSTSAAPPAKANRFAGGAKPQPQAQKEPVQTKASSSWADQVEREMAGADADGSAKRGRKGGKPSSTAGGSKGAAQSSTSGWGTVEEMPW